MTSPITPPDELVQKWINEEDGLTAGHIATQAAQWGADQELEACEEWVAVWISAPEASQLRAARRPTPLGKADQALADLDAFLSNHGMKFETANLRRALERLKELEGQGND